MSTKVEVGYKNVKADFSSDTSIIQDVFGIAGEENSLFFGIFVVCVVAFVVVYLVRKNIRAKTIIAKEKIAEEESPKNNGAKK